MTSSNDTEHDSTAVKSLLSVFSAPITAANSSSPHDAKSVSHGAPLPVSSFPSATLNGARTTPKIPGSWADTINSYTLGYGTRTVRSLAVTNKGKGKARGSIPFWSAATPESETEETSTLKEDAKEDSMAELGLNGEIESIEFDILAARILYEAGSDAGDTSGPLLIIAPCHVPPSTAISHAALLTKLSQRLEIFASAGPYSIVLLATPTPNPPSSAQLVSSFLGLSKLTRKNVQRVWIVGGGWWIRLLMNLFTTTLLSGKTAKKRKIVQVTSLSDLVKELGPKNFVQIEFPLQVYAAHEPTIQLPLQLPAKNETNSSVFGTELSQLMGAHAEKGLPKILLDCFEILEIEGPDSIGIFRRSPSAANLKILEGVYDRGNPITLSEYPDAAYLAASLVKSFFRSLPTPIFPSSIYSTVQDCPLPSTPPYTTSVDYIVTKILPLFDPPVLLVLKSLCRVLHAISVQSELNLMSSDNLCVCICPALVGGLGVTPLEIEMIKVPGRNVGSMRGIEKFETIGENGKSNSVGGVIKILIERYSGVFESSASPREMISPASSPRSKLITIPEANSASMKKIASQSSALSATLSRSFSADFKTRSSVAAVVVDGPVLAKFAGHDSSDI